jgi:Mn-dependent DtxR family transcriptional regulator
MEKDDTGKRSVKTAETVFEIVDLLDEVGSASLTTIATELDMPRSTLHPYLTTLVDQEYVSRPWRQGAAKRAGVQAVKATAPGNPGVEADNTQPILRLSMNK